MAIIIENVDRLIAELQKLPDKLKRSELLKILRQGAKPTLEAAKANLANHKKTGNLQKSISTFTGKSKINPNVQVGASAKKKGTHAHLLELGTAPRKTKKGKFTGAVSAKPFMRPAYDATKNQAAENINKATAKYLTKVANQ